MQQLRMGRHEMIGGDQIDALAAIRGVTDVEGRLWGYFYDASSGANYTFQVPSDPAPCPVLARCWWARGCSGRAATWEGAPLFLSRYTGDMVKFEVARTFTADSAGLLRPRAAERARFPRLLQPARGGLDRSGA
ncbi:MAG: hypothetical protein R3D80_14555 [Paracoccaceae bacterium]